MADSARNRMYKAASKVDINCDTPIEQMCLIGILRVQLAMACQRDCRPVYTVVAQVKGFQRTTPPGHKTKSLENIRVERCRFY